MGQGNHLADRLVDVQASLPRRHLLDEGPDPADDIAGSRAVLDDTAERLANLLEIGPLSAQPAQGGLSIDDRRGDRLVDLMGDRGRQLPHPGDAIGGAELHHGLAVPPPTFPTLALLPPPLPPIY